MRSDSGLGYRTELDGIRGVAILAVMVFHSDLWFRTHGLDGGTLGVDLFFVLSGFLITTLLLDERRMTGTISRPNFYMRRALRLLPALLIALVGAGVVVRIVGTNGVKQMPFGQSALAALFFAGNFFQYKLGTLGHTWSLGVEEQYYLLWPFVLAYAIRKKVPAKKIAVGLLIAIAFVSASRSFVYHRYTSASTVWRFVHPWSQSDAILIGSLFAVWWATDAGRIRELVRSRELGWAALICGVAIGIRSALANAATFDLLLLANICCAVIIVHAVAAPSGPIGRLLRVRPLPEIGRISYGLYLYHWPVFLLLQHERPVTVPSAIAAWAWSFVAAIVSYYLIERPILGLKSRFSGPRRVVVRRTATEPLPVLRTAS
jgi:peptidoglycan/LPS O-acetylase OafA/YrhL